MAPWQRNVNVRLSNAWDTRCVTNFASGMMRRSAMWQNNITEVTIATAGKATSTTATTTTSGRIAMTVVVVTTTTNAKRNGRTRLLLIAATRDSSHAWCTGQRASTPLRSATRISRTINVNFKTKTSIRSASQQCALHERWWQVAP